MSEFLNSVWMRISLLSAEQLLLILIALCLLLVLMMGLALLTLHSRTKRAERQVEKISGDVAGQLSATQEAAREGREASQRELSEAMATVNDSMMRMMGEMTRTQQGQMDALGGQLRAAGRLEEERLERMRQTMDTRLSTYEERLGGVSKTLDDKLAGNEARMDRMRETLEEGMRTMREDNRGQLEMMRQTVDEKLSATVDRRLEASFDAVKRRLE